MQPFNIANAGTHRIWTRDVQPYVKNLAVFRCPEAKPRSTDGTCAAGGGTCETTEAPPNMAGNGNLHINGIVASKSLAAITTPADTIFNHEVRNINRVAQEKPRGILVNGEVLYTNFANGYYDKLHSGGTNLLFCDGHAKWQRRSAMRMAQFGAPESLNPGMPTNLSDDDATCNALGALIYRAEF
jgi:prepilin-type processing-associated H-X9-DG protein